MQHNGNITHYYKAQHIWKSIICSNFSYVLAVNSLGQKCPSPPPLHLQHSIAIGANPPRPPPLANGMLFLAQAISSQHNLHQCGRRTCVHQPLQRHPRSL